MSEGNTLPSDRAHNIQSDPAFYLFNHVAKTETRRGCMGRTHFRAVESHQSVRHDHGSTDILVLNQGLRLTIVNRCQGLSLRIVLALCSATHQLLCISPLWAAIPELSSGLTTFHPRSIRGVKPGYAHRHFLLCCLSPSYQASGNRPPSQPGPQR